jgi:hypothetical protein
VRWVWHTVVFLVVLLASFALLWLVVLGLVISSGSGECNRSDCGTLAAGLQEHYRTILLAIAAVAFTAASVVIARRIREDRY